MRELRFELGTAAPWIAYRLALQRLAAVLESELDIHVEPGIQATVRFRAPAA
ncbi:MULTISPECIES: hypothetical protein [unclassified Kitasatospora]